ncbi:hypothetical protein [Nonomuraea maritima]|uniref:hypothetical protein n=1 Tax=Nonomuraea maritima TaxID=683260 RepID=UPI003716D89C
MSWAELHSAVSDFTTMTDGGAGGGYVGVVATGDGCAAVEPLGWSGTIDSTPRGCLHLPVPLQPLTTLASLGGEA